MNLYVNKTINLAFSARPLSETDEKEIRDGYTPDNAQKLIQTATKKKVLPVVAKLMCRLDLDTALWQEKYDFFKNRNVQITQMLAQLFQLLDASGVTQICAYENYGAMLAADTDIALYSSGDVDLYAHVCEKEKLTRVLADFGYFPVSDEKDARNIATEYISAAHAIRINIAWKPLIRYALPQKADTAKRFDFNAMGRYRDTAIRIPGPETLLYLCFLRIAVHGYSRSPDIRLYIDTYNATRNDPDWETVMAWAAEDGTTTKFVTVAAIAHDLIGIDVPDFVLEQAQKDYYCQKILAIAYDFENHTLRYDPSGLQLLKLEAASECCSVLRLGWRMLFPPTKWLEEYYLSPGEKNYKKYLNYYKHLL